MYRPNRIGPWPFVDLDVDTEVMTGEVFNAGASGLLKPGFNVQDTVVNSEYRSRAFNMIPVSTFSTITGVCIGVQIDGSELDNASEYMLSYAGNVRWSANDEGITVQPIIGRAETDGGPGTTFIIDPYTPVPALNATFGNITESEGMKSCNGTVIVSQSNNSASVKSGNLCFGFWFQNPTLNSIQITNVLGGLSIHRYLSDVNTFDPNR